MQLKIIVNIYISQNLFKFIFLFALKENTNPSQKCTNPVVFDEKNAFLAPSC